MSQIAHVWENPEVQVLPVAEFIGAFLPAYYAARWEDIDYEGNESYEDPDDPDGEFDQRFLSGGDTGFEFDELVDSVADHGVTSPVAIEDGKVTDGHHRVVAAMLTGNPVPYQVWGSSAPLTFGEADDLVQAFLNGDGRAYESVCSDATRTAGVAEEVAHAFVAYLRRETAHEAEVLFLVAQGHLVVPDGTTHVVVRVDSTVVALAHRHLDRGCEVPHVEPIGRFLVGWSQEG